MTPPPWAYGALAAGLLLVAGVAAMAAYAVGQQVSDVPRHGLEGRCGPAVGSDPFGTSVHYAQVTVGVRQRTPQGSFTSSTVYERTLGGPLQVNTAEGVKSIPVSEGVLQRFLVDSRSSPAPPTP